MEKFPELLTGKVAIWSQSNIDTDMIIPSDFLKVTKTKGLGVHLFDGLRFKDKGGLYQNPETREKNPDFFLNKKEFEGAKILIAGENFGCGSSREHAAWALKDYGFKVIIAPSFADIFYENAFKNGLLLITLDLSHVDEKYLEILNINLIYQKIVCDMFDDDDIIELGFEIDPLKKKILLKGLDEIDSSQGS